MKMLDMVEFQMMAGIRAPSRDMSDYSGKSFQCACGDDHLFSPFMDFDILPPLSTSSSVGF